MTKPLDDLLDAIKNCDDCSLMEENTALGIPSVRILPKPNALVMFVGRDPSPRTATVVGLRGGKSSFINEIFRINDETGLPDEFIYITDLCKCHWRTSVGTPLPSTKNRPTLLDKKIANICMQKWLFREAAIIKPHLIVAFGEEVYQLLRDRLTSPNPAPEKLSASKNKSVLDAESWFVHHGPMTINIFGDYYPFAILRHPGNSYRLTKSSEDDQRLHYHQEATKVVTSLIKELRIE